MVLVILEAVEVFVALPADLASVGLVFLHSKSAGVGIKSLRIHN